jgi:DNA-binding GntR family transcriptional regulator
VNPAGRYFYGRYGGRFMSFLLKDQAYDMLIQLINEGKLNYGEIYSLNALAADLKMSRTPVRDAIQKLADENRIDILPSRGIQLHLMTPEEFAQHYHFSIAIEGYCAICLTKAYQKDMQNSYVQRMQVNLRTMHELISDQEFGAFFALDQQFHGILLDSLGDPYFSSLQDSPMGFYNHPELQQSPKKLPRQAIFQCHQKILDAICAGDPSAAYQGVIDHAQLMYRAL